jgi:hypothetical protein
MIMAWVLTILAWLAFLVSEWAGFSSEKWPVVSNPIFEKAALVIAIILTLRAIFWLPFRRHEKLAAELEAVKPQPPKIRAIPVEQTTGNKFERPIEVKNENKDRPLVAEPAAINKSQPPKIKAPVPEQTTGNKFERPIEVKTESKDRPLVAELAAINKSQPLKIKTPPVEQTTGNKSERPIEVGNESKGKPSAAELEAINKSQPPKIKPLPPEQTTGNKFERPIEVGNESKDRTLVAELEAINKSQPPKIKPLPPKQTRGNIFERLRQFENESAGKTVENGEEEPWKTEPPPPYASSSTDLPLNLAVLPQVKSQDPLVAELETTDKPQQLKIKALPPEQTIGNKFECLIEVENESDSKTAENLEVKLWKIDPIPKYASSKTDLPLVFPILPQAKSKNPSVINPKDSARFVLFNVTQTLSEVAFEVAGVGHNAKTFSHRFWEWPPNYPFPKGKPPEVLEYRITLSVSSNSHALVKETFKLECPSRWIHEKPFTLTKI